MAISLNSINTRVTSLESKITSKGVFKIIYSGVGYGPGTYSFNTSIDSFDMLVFGSYYANDGLGARIYNTAVISVADFKKYQAITATESENLRYKFISTTSFQMSRSGSLLGSPVYGLKL